jgi:hypothetical protein
MSGERTNKGRREGGDANRCVAWQERYVKLIRNPGRSGSSGDGAGAGIALSVLDNLGRHVDIDEGHDASGAEQLEMRRAPTGWFGISSRHRQSNGNQWEPPKNQPPSAIQEYAGLAELGYPHGCILC